MKFVLYLQINNIFLQIDNITLISLQYLKENVKDGVYFSLLIIVKRFFKVILSFFMYAARHAQIPKTISLQYLKGEVNGEVEFLHAGKHENLLQIDIMVLMDMVKHFQSSQNSKFTISVQYLKKEDSDDVDFLHADKYRSVLQVDFNTLGIKAAYKAILLLLIGMMKHSQITQSNNFANLCSISKKLRAEFIFCIQINTKVSKNWHYRF